MIAPRAGRVVQIGNGIADVSEAHALKAAREKSAAPVVVVEELSAGLAFVGGGHDDECGEVAGFAAETVAQPCAHAGASGDLGTGHEERHAGGVVDRLGCHGADDADVVGHGTDFREHGGEGGPGFAEGLEGFDGGGDGPAFVVRGHGREAGGASDTVGDVLSCHLGEDGFWVIEIDMGGAASLPEADDAFGFWGQVGEVW